MVPPKVAPRKSCHLCFLSVFTSAPVTAPSRLRGNYDVVVALFCSFLLISNVCATKLIPFGASGATPVMFGPVQLWPIIIDGGALLFPLTYVFGDVLAEVYGFRRARRAIFIGFAVSLLASLTFLLVGAMPALDPELNAAFTRVLGFVPRIVAASLVAYLCGQLMNAVVLVRMKARTREGSLWARLLGSTLVGELVDTVVFCTIAFVGIISIGELINYIVVGYLWKVGVEAVLLPVTYRVIALVKRHEPEADGLQVDEQAARVINPIDSHAI